MKIFISYCHIQGDWVWNKLVPCLEADGAEVLIDRERFEVGKAVIGQMDAVQDQAAKHVLVLSDEYLGSPYCCHEMGRAVRLDPRFANGIIIPVLRCRCTLPTKISKHHPVYADLQDVTLR